MPKLDILLNKIKEIDNINTADVKKYKVKRYRAWDHNIVDKITNRTQTGHKPNTNRTQTEHKPNTTEHKLDTKQEINRTQLNTTEHKLDTKQEINRTQPNTTGHKLDTKQEINRTQLNTTGHKLDTKQEINRTQLNTTEHKLDTKQEINRTQLNTTGNELKILIFLCREVSISKSKNLTSNLSISDISIATSIVIGSIKTSINRLIKKQLIGREIFSKGGKNSKTIYKIKDKILKDIKKYQGEHKCFSKITRPIYNSNNIITTINNKEEENIDSENPWMSINIFPLEQYGLKQSHLKQLQKMNCTNPEIVQESIHHMAYGLENTKDTKKYDYPIKVLMGVLKKGDAWIEEKYIDPNERALKKIIDARKRKLLAKQKMITELKDIEFNNWFEELTESKLLNIIEETDGAGGIITEMYKKDKKISKMTKGTILQYFNETVWGEIKKDMNI
jgi:hypothetical protein